MNDNSVLETQLLNASFAPNSNMNFYIDWDTEPLETGDYRLELSASNDDDDWEWVEEFTIEGK